MNVIRYEQPASCESWMVEHNLGDYVEYVDYTKLYLVAKQLAEALHNLPCLSDDHLQIKDAALTLFNKYENL